jgi:hypothetical protein
MLGYPSDERRLGVTDENREVRSLGCSSKETARVAQLHLGLLAHGAIVRTGSAAAAAPQRTMLGRARHNPQRAARIGQLGRLSQCRFAAAAGFKEDEDTRGRSRGRAPRTVEFAHR